MLRFLAAFVLAALAFAAQATVDSNNASQAELETLKGIGPGLLGKLLDARKSDKAESALAKPAATR
jgi:competence protein ComEA